MEWTTLGDVKSPESPYSLNDLGPVSRLWISRWRYAAELVRLGYNVFVADLDVFITQNPYPFLKSPAAMGDHSVIAQKEGSKFPSLNCGLVYIQDAEANRLEEATEEATEEAAATTSSGDEGVSGGGGGGGGSQGQGQSRSRSRGSRRSGGFDLVRRIVRWQRSYLTGEMTSKHHKTGEPLTHALWEQTMLNSAFERAGCGCEVPLLGRESEFEGGHDAMIAEQKAFWKRWNKEFPGPAGPVMWTLSPEDSTVARPTPVATARREAETRSNAVTGYQVEWIPLYPLVVAKNHSVPPDRDRKDDDDDFTGLFERYGERGMSAAAADGHHPLASSSSAAAAAAAAAAEDEEEEDDESRLERGAAAPVWLFGLLAEPVYSHHHLYAPQLVHCFKSRSPPVRNAYLPQLKPQVERVRVCVNAIDALGCWRKATVGPRWRRSPWW